MGKPTGKKKAPGSPKPGEASGRKLTTERSSKAFDEDTAIFINMSQELKEEGNKLYQKHDHEGAMLKFEKALKLLPKNHIDVAYLRTNMAACYMQMGLGEYPRAINECNLALEISPKYSKALLKRAKCYESLNRLDLAYRDVNHVLSMEPNNLAALEILESVQKAMTGKGLSFDEKVIGVTSTELTGASRLRKVVKEKMKKKKTKRGSNEGQEEKQKGDDEGEEEEKKKGNDEGEEEEKKKGNDEGEEEKKGSDEGEEEKKKGSDEGEEEKKKSNGEGKEEKKKGNDEGKEKNEKKKKKVEYKEKVVEEEKDGSPVVKKTIEEQKVFMKDVKEEKAITKTVKLVLGEDIRWAQMPVNCSIGLLRDIVRDRFPGLKGVLVKYKDQEGDLITITSTEELRLAESSGTAKGPLGSLRFYVVEVSLDQEPAYDGTKIEDEVVTKGDKKLSTSVENGDVGNGVEVESRPTCIEDWIIEFARLFKNHVGFDSDTYLDLHELGMKLYSEAMEDSVTSEDAQELFDIAADKFQEMTALALFNWGNVHFSKARKRVFFSEDAPKESLLAQVKIAYNWANEEYMKAGMRYRESLSIKPDFYEGLLALGLQQFEQAKLCWYYAIGSKIDLESGPSEEVLDLYNKAEDSMERGMQMWEEMEEQRLNGLSKFDKNKEQLKKMGLDGLLKELSAEEAAEQAANMSSQIYLLWGTMLYERSVVEYKLELPTWEECLEVAVEKFELAGASPTDLAVMIKNHCSNETALEGMGFKIDEIVQAWNEMYDAKRWEVGVPSFRLEPLFRRRVPKLHFMLEHA